MININEIIVSVKNNKITFSKKKNELIKIITLNEDNIDNNIISDNKMVFDEKYILSNIKIIANFINGIAIEKNINSIHISELEIVPVIIRVINNVKCIINLYIDENEKISFDIYESLKGCKYLKYVDCHSIPLYMLDELDKKGIKINIRTQYLSAGNFIIKNRLSSYSKMYYKESIIFDKILDDTDINDFSMFLKTNNHLKIINIYNFSFDLVNKIVELLEENNIRNILIIIRAEVENAEVIQNSMEYFKTMNKVYGKSSNIKFKIKYSSLYKRKNSLKQLSMNIVVAGCFILNFLMLFGFIYTEYNNYMTKKSVESLNKVTKVEVNNSTIPDSNPTVIESNNTDNNTDSNISNLPTQEETKDNKTHSNLTEDYNKLKSINSDTVGWLKVNNTNIDYPVVKTNDNDYYLKHGFYKNSTVNGWVFMDFRNDVNDLGKNTIIYGHNLKNGLMFGSLRKVINSSWYSKDSNLNITFNTINQKMTWRVFSIYIIDVTNDYIYTYFEDDNDFMNFLNKIKSRSFRDFNTSVSASDKILTLSTCQSNGTKRLVVHAKLVK